MTRLLAICLLLLPLSGCLSEKRESGWSDSDVAAFFSGGGGAAVRPAPAQPAPGYGQPAPGSQAPGTGAAKMLQDPEAQESSETDYVWADSAEAARNMCQRTAERYGWRLDDVQEDRGIQLQTGRRRFSCYWTVFGR